MPKEAAKGFTNQQKRIFSLIYLTNTQIAFKFGMQVRTVEKHVAMMLKKTGTQTRTGLLWHGMAKGYTVDAQYLGQ